jgi:hypothetical protein
MLSAISVFIPIESIIIEVIGKNNKNNKKLKVNKELNTEIKSKIINVSIVNFDEIKKYIQKTDENIININLIIFFDLKNPSLI